MTLGLATLVTVNLMVPLGDLASKGVTFDAGISVRATTGRADDDTGAPTTGDVVLNLFYK